MEKTDGNYWICADCADKKGWNPVPWAVTVHERECPYCGEKKAVACAQTDLIKEGKGPKVWD